MVPELDNTRKVGDIKENNKALLLFPGIEKDKFYEIDGRAEFAPRSEVEEK